MTKSAPGRSFHFATLINHALLVTIFLLTFISPSIVAQDAEPNATLCAGFDAAFLIDLALGKLPEAAYLSSFLVSVEWTITPWVSFWTDIGYVGAPWRLVGIYAWAAVPIFRVYFAGAAPTGFFVGAGLSALWDPDSTGTSFFILPVAQFGGKFMAVAGGPFAEVIFLISYVPILTINIGWGF